MYTKIFDKKPPMSEKLLTKPPFKYLFDIVVALIKTTKFAEGLYTPAELDANLYAVKHIYYLIDKRTKNDFLTKNN